MFYIIKKASGWWHRLDNFKETSFSDWEIILEAVTQTVVLELPNGANFPQKAIQIADVVLIDETDAGVQETFVSVEALEVRLEALQYPPYLDESGLSQDIKDALNNANAPDASNPFATIADLGGGGSGVQSVTGDLVDNTDPLNPIILTPSLQQSTDAGNSTSNNIIVTDGTDSTTIKKNSVEILSGGGAAANSFAQPDGAVATFYAESSNGNYAGISSLNSQGARIVGSNGNAEFQIDASLLTGTKNINFRLPDKASGNYTMATTDDIPSPLGFTPEDVANKSTNVNTDQASNTKYPSVKSVFDWATGLFQTISGLPAAILSQVLTGFTGTAGTVTSSDSILSAINKIVGNIAANTTAIGTKVTENTVVDYSATSTVVGWASFTTKNIRYLVVGKITHVWFYIEGTSNSTAVSFTIPSNHTGPNNFQSGAYAVNNGSGLNTAPRIDLVSGSNVVNISRLMSTSTTWINTGTKAVSGYFTYEN